LFISKIDDTQLNSILEIVGSVPVLTISNTTDFAAKGVILNFYETESKTPFEVNFKSLKKSGVYIDAILLDNVKIVEPIND